jgi:hypothetical protein
MLPTERPMIGHRSTPSWSRSVRCCRAKSCIVAVPAGRAPEPPWPYRSGRIS